jgi:REP element-mobilizing transposase RayT
MVFQTLTGPPSLDTVRFVKPLTCQCPQDLTAFKIQKEKSINLVLDFTSYQPTTAKNLINKHVSARQLADLTALNGKEEEMQQVETLSPGKFYHIYNCGINGENLFRRQEDYERFLWLLEKYILPICEVYAWVLMKNHFHFLVKIKENLVYKYSNADGVFDKEKFNGIKWETVETTNFQTLTGPPSADSVRFEDRINLSVSVGPDSVKDPNSQRLKIPQPHLHFSHLFNAYTKYFNFTHKRHGNLFERPFKRKEIDNKHYFKNVVIYIHQNPVHHGFCEHILDYGWSSYLTCLSIKPTHLKREEVIGWFDEKARFKIIHDKLLDITEIENYLGL